MEPRSLPHPEHGLITDLGSSLFDLVQRGRYMHFQASAGHPKLPAFQEDPYPASPELFRHCVAPDVLGKNKFQFYLSHIINTAFLIIRQARSQSFPRASLFTPLWAWSIVNLVQGSQDKDYPASAISTLQQR